MLRVHALGLIAMGSVMSITVTSPVIPLYLDGLGLPPQHVGGIIGATSLAIIVTELLAMAMSHLLGRRRTVILALVASALMFGTFPLAASLGGLYASRLALGAVRGFLWPVLFAEVAEHGPPERRGAQFAVFWLYFGFGQLFSPALGGWLGETISLAAPFYAGAVICLLTIPAGFVVRTQHDPNPGNPMAAYVHLLHRTPTVARTWLLTVCNTTIVAVFATFLPLHAAARGVTTAQIGIIFTAGATSFILAQWVIGRLAGRIAVERLLVPGFLVRGLGVAAVPWLGSFAALSSLNFVGSFASAGIPNAVSMRITARAPREYLVPAMGGFNAAADVGFFVGPALGGVLAGVGLQWPFLMVLPVLGIALLVLVLPEPPVQPDARPAPDGP
ncbi:MAG TPA: MFS transporter [bacterium]|jgi:MFS family permease|nr:MFS transporter [bacterium]